MRPLLVVLLPLVFAASAAASVGTAVGERAGGDGVVEARDGARTVAVLPAAAPVVAGVGERATPGPPAAPAERASTSRPERPRQVRATAAHVESPSGVERLRKHRVLRL